MRFPDTPEEAEKWEPTQHAQRAQRKITESIWTEILTATATFGQKPCNSCENMEPLQGPRSVFSTKFGIAQVPQEVPSLHTRVAWRSAD